MRGKKLEGRKLRENKKEKKISHIIWLKKMRKNKL